MESRKRLYKLTKNVPTLSERVKKANNKRNDTRKNAFNANRQIDLDDSISTPRKPAPVKISQIKDKSQKLKAYIEQKKSAKFKSALESRSPFIPFVPCGRWLEKKEQPRRPKNVVITTPVRKALMNNDKILKKATMKELATTVKKEISTTIKRALPVVGSKSTEVKSRKKILVESNVIAEIPIDQLNSTFEVLEESSDENSQPNKILQEPTKSVVVRESLKVVSMPEKIKKDIRKVEKKPVPVKKVTAKEIVPVKKAVPLKKPVAAAKIVKPVKRPVVAPKITKPQEPSSPVLPPVEEVTVKPSKDYSRTYKFYKSSLDNQRAYVSLQLKEVTGNLDSFIQLLPEDTQTLVHKNIQQGNRIVNEKMANFMDVLEKFEDDNEKDVKHVTEDDVENYWDLLYDEINTFKEELIFMREAKKFAIEEANQKKKRRTTKVYDGTPRRSRRIADLGDTPNNHSCFGCTPISASKVNTPKSNKKRRTLFKNKELSFD